MDTLRQDLTYALRRLGHAPGFTLVAVATLALGIGANTAIFSVIDGVLLRPLPFAQPERLVQLGQTWQGKRTAYYSPQNFLDVAATARSFESLAALVPQSLTLTSAGMPRDVDGAAVSVSFFDVLRAHPTLGRGFVAGENEPGKARVAVLGHGLWTSRFGGLPGIVGQTIQIEREPYLVVGVAPAGFAYPEHAELWIPLEYDARFRSQSRGAWYLNVIGRLTDAASLAAADREVAGIALNLARQYPDVDAGVGGAVTPLHDALVGDSRPALLLLASAVGLVLLIACVNVANLLLARLSLRASELSLRSALGAGRGRLLRQLLTESAVLAACGGAAGLVVAAGTLQLLLGLEPQGVARLGEVRLDRSAMLFTALLSLLTGLLFGAFPALAATRGTEAQALREGARTLSTRSHARLRGGLVVGQLALAMMLLAGAGLLIRSFAQLRQVDPGFTTESALTFRIALPDAGYSDPPRRRALYDELIRQLAVLPGVESAGAISRLPLSGSRFSFSFAVVGRPALPPAEQPSMELRSVTPGYFDALGIRVERGRGIEAGDSAGARQVVVLNAAAARRFFAGQEPLGQVIRLGYGQAAGEPPAGGEVVGIVGDVKESLASEAPPTVYLPHAQLPLASMDVLLKTAGSPHALDAAVLAAVQRQDPQLPVTRLRPLQEVIARSISQPRFQMLLLAAFAGCALTLAAIGVFGVMSFVVQQRSREIGIRAALGADRSAILRLIVGNALGLIAAGIALGLVGALLLSRTLAGLLYELRPDDPATLAATAGVLASTALVASWLPARRAARADPLLALRHE